MQRLAEIYPPLLHQLNLQVLIPRPLTTFGSNRISKTNSIVRRTDHTRINAQTRQICKPSSAKGFVCPNNGSFQYLYKCSHLQDLSPLDRREQVKKLKLCSNCFGMHTTLNQAIRSSSTVKSIQLHGTGQVAFLTVQLFNGEKMFET